LLPCHVSASLSIELTANSTQRPAGCSDQQGERHEDDNGAATVSDSQFKVGEFPFHCDVFCGSGHDQMEGTIKVTE